MILATSHSHNRCRICGSAQLVSYLNQGVLPLANAYRHKRELTTPEFCEELMLQVCLECGLSQLSKVVQPDVMFGTYLYTSSVAKTFREHCARLAQALAARVGLTASDLVLDIASNDGCLLREFKPHGCRITGVDPAENLATAATVSGIPTINAYWSRTLATYFAQDKPKIITAQNVLGHVDDLDDFIAGVGMALSPDGLFVVEAPYVLDFLERTEFDTAYHEHLSYIGVSPLRQLIRGHGLELCDVEYFPDLHGGTLRYYVCWPDAYPVSENVSAYIDRETTFGLTQLEPYRAFAKRVQIRKEQFLALLDRVAGCSIWAYGASAKGITLLNCLHIDEVTISKIIDDTPAKKGLYIPGTRIEIIGGLECLRADVEYLLLLAWNFKDELIAKCRATGYQGKFIIPIPEPLIL